MLRIDLLPTYVKQRRVTKQVITAFVIAAILCVALPMLFYVYKEKQLKDLTAKADAAVAGKAKTDASKALAASTLALVDPIKAKIDFVAAVLDYPRHWVQFYNTLADVTPRNSFIYSGTTLGAGAAAGGSSQGGYGSSGVTTASTGPNSVTIQAYSKSVAEVGRYLQAMYREPDFTTVAVDKVPGYPDNIRNLYYYGKTLVFADDATSSGASSGGSSSGGRPGGSSGGRPGGSPGGYPGGYPTGGGGTGQNSGTTGLADYNTTNLGPNAPGNIPPGVGPPPPELTGGVSTAGGNTPGGYGAGGRQTSPSGRPGGQQNGQAGGAGAAAIIYGEVYDRVAGSNISPFASPEVRQSILRARLRRVVKKTVPRGFD
ncbi:MAG: hypothetical protein M3Y28_09585, partial [Armatimonadota bacterium]|nr:hypothetical protein [Armatimonadota bacterium]